MRTGRPPRTASTLRRLLTLLIAWVVLLVGIAVAVAVTAAWPQAFFVGILVALVAALWAVIGMRTSVGHWWTYWLIVPTVAIAGIGALMLGEDLALDRTGELTDVTVTSHTVDTSRNSDGNLVYVHTYTLEGEDGSLIAEPMIYRGEDGFDGIDEGSRITVLIDPEGKAPTEPAENVDLGTDIGILTVGTVTSTLVMAVGALVIVFRREREGV